MTSTRHGRPPASEPAPEGPVRKAVIAFRWVFAAETREYFVLLGTTLFLVVFGLVMVLSSSSIQSLVDDGDVFSRASRQAVFAVLDVVPNYAQYATDRLWSQLKHELVARFAIQHVQAR